MQACQNHGEVYVLYVTAANGKLPRVQEERERGPDGNGKARSLLLIEKKSPLIKKKLMIQLTFLKP